MELNGISMEKMKSFRIKRERRVLVRHSFQPAGAEKRIINVTLKDASTAVFKRLRP